MNDEDKFDIFGINNNNENEPVCLFDEYLGNFDEPVNNEKKINNCQSTKSTETISYK